jgi:hypothetical protein
MADRAFVNLTRLELEEREAFLLNSLYAIGLATVAGKRAGDLVESFNAVLRGPLTCAALWSLSGKMSLNSRAIDSAAMQRMAVEP